MAVPIEYASAAGPTRLPVRFPWRTVAVSLVAWLATVPITVRYVLPATPFGPIADGPSRGYEMCYAYGLAGGCVERQVRHRQSAAEVGWQCRLVTRTDVGELVVGRGWPISTTALPLCLAMFLPCARWAVRVVQSDRGSSVPHG